MCVLFTLVLTFCVNEKWNSSNGFYTGTKNGLFAAMNGSSAMFTVQSDFFPCQNAFFPPRTNLIYIDNFLTEKQPVNLTRNKGYVFYSKLWWSSKKHWGLSLKRRENCFDRGV